METDEIRELKAWAEELQAQVLSAGRLTSIVADWIVASPGVMVQRHDAVEGDGAAATAAGHVRRVHGPVLRLWKKPEADNLAAATREATAEAAAAAAEAAECCGWLQADFNKHSTDQN